MLRMLRDSWRAWRQTPVVAALAVVSLALGIGAVTACYAIVDGLLLRVLDVPEPHRLTTLTTEDEPRYGRVTFLTWQQLEQRAHLYEGAYAWTSRGLNVAPAGPIDMRVVTWASGGVFKTLGVREAGLGRLFDERDDAPGGGPDGAVAVISHAFWLSRFGAAPDAIGRTLTLERVPFTIIGVAPRSLPGLAVGGRFDVILPLQLEPLVEKEFSRVRSKAQPFLNVSFRLRQGQSATQLTAALQAEQSAIRDATIGGITRRQQREQYLRSRFLAVPSPAGNPLAGDYYGRPAAIALGLGALALVACCTNVALVMLAHADRRRHELSVRMAMGASRWDAARQLLVDSVSLTGIGAVAGWLLAHWASPQLAAAMTASGLIQEIDATATWRVWLCASGLGLVSGVLCGLAAARRVARIDAAEALKASDPRHRAPARAQSAAVVLQMSVSVVVIVTSGLLLRSYAGLARSTAFSNVTGVVTAELQLHKSGIAAENRPTVIERIEAAARTVPALTTALSMNPPLSFGGGGYFWSIDAADGSEPTMERSALMNAVSPSYFDLLRVPLVSGRRFDARDVKGAPRVGVASRLFARKFLNGDTHVPSHVRVGTGKDAFDLQIVGVVGDLPDLSFGEPPQPALYVPRDQDVVQDGVVYLVMRSMTSAPVGVAAVSAAIEAAAPDVSFRMTAMEAEARNSIARERVLAALAVFFVGLTALVAVLGLFGVMSVDVTSRRREIGVRLAVGARPVQVGASVIARAARLVALGMAVGLSAAWWTTSYTSSLLVETAPRDPVVLLATAATLMVLGILAAAWPAQRAARVEPAEVLRAE